MRVFLRLLVNINAYDFLEEPAAYFSINENEQRSDDEVVLTGLSNTADEKLTGLALRLVLADHIGVPRENEPDLLAEAESVFAPKKPKAVKSKDSKNAKPAPVKAVLKKKATIKKAA